MTEMRPHLLLAAALLALCAIAGCRDAGGEGRYFELSGHLFSFNYRISTAVYIITLNPVRPMEEGQTVVATLENPAGGEPIVVRQKVWPKLSHVTVESPPLQCVLKDRPYAVSLVVEDASGKALQTIETTVTSTLDQSVLPDRPLVLGSVYERNPELGPDGRLIGGKPKADACPKS